MFLKACGILTPVAAGGLWYSGALAGNAYSHDFTDSHIDTVAIALSDLDITGMPRPSTKKRKGAPNFELGFMSVPRIRSERTSEGYNWYVMSGDETAMQLKATLTQINGGKGTRVRGYVTQGSLSEPSKVAPMYYTPGAMETLFGMALEAELAELGPGTPAEKASRRAAAEENRRRAHGAMMASQIIANPGAVQQDMQRMMTEVSSQLKAPPKRNGAVFVPGRPMTSARPSSSDN
jgi:hypothetical protein